MSKPLIVVATPCFGGLVTHSYMMSILQLTQRATLGGYDIDVMVLGGNSLISRARSVLVSHFLANPLATHLLFVDADIAFDTDQVLRLLHADKDFVAGFYPLKHVDWDELPTRVVGGETLETAGLSYVGHLSPKEELRVEAGFATAVYAGTGFQLIKRCVLERMMAAYPELQFRSVHAASNQQAPKDHLFALFDCMIDAQTGTYLSEDYSFCRRWTAIGGEIWLDLRSKLSHAGMQHFSGDCSVRFSSLLGPSAMVPGSQLRAA